ncbi:hypothetical protein AFLA_003702 [Aspergillus flavus NRRL3357]|nr:hypothetical protein AFLA_003702 [Aspergillus flavus NRRL3357]
MPTHPYYSTMAEIPNYIPNDKRTFELVSIFALTCSIILTITYAFVLTKHPQISKSDLLTTLWSKGEYFWGYFVFLNAFWVVVLFGLRLLWESIVDWRC